MSLLKQAEMNLFSDLENLSINKVLGLNYVSNFITYDEQKKLLSEIDNSLWLDDLKRRVQHYGYKYDYKKRNIDRSMHLGDIPVWAKDIAIKMQETKLIDVLPDQVIVNEYQPGQGITSHIDCETCFENVIVSLSLGSDCVMQFINKHDPEEIIPILLEPCSLLVLKDTARYEWLHGIKAVKSDKYDGMKIVRQRRVSLTFRKVILGKSYQDR